MRARRVFSTLMVVSLGGAAIDATTDDRHASDGLAIVVNVTDFAGVPEWDLRPALDQAARAFQAVGITVLWRKTAQDIDGVDQPPAFDLRLLSAAMVARKCAAEGIGPNVLARSAPALGRAWIFAHRIGANAAGPDLLGKVITHELGHLLLPQHNRGLLIGIMQEQLINRVGFYRFTAAQGRQMRSRLREFGHPSGVLADSRIGR